MGGDATEIESVAVVSMPSIKPNRLAPSTRQLKPSEVASKLDHDFGAAEPQGGNAR